MSKVEFTAEEYARMARVVERLLAARKQLTDKEWQKGNNMLIKQLARKFTPQATFIDQTIPMSRPQLRFIETSVAEAVSVLRDKVIPEYHKRGPENKDEYITKAEDMARIYEAILTKVQAVL